MNPDMGHEVVAPKKEELRSKLSGFLFCTRQTQNET